MLGSFLHYLLTKNIFLVDKNIMRIYNVNNKKCL